MSHFIMKQRAIIRRSHRRHGRSAVHCHGQSDSVLLCCGYVYVPSVLYFDLLIHFQGVCWMFYYPADDFDGRVNNDSQSERYAVDWNQIQESYRDSPDIDLGLGTWPLCSCFDPRTAQSRELSASSPHVATPITNIATA